MLLQMKPADREDARKTAFFRLRRGFNDHHAQESKKCTETRSEEREAREAPTKDCDDKRIDELE
ncbi:hypothetical protein PGT21_024898 [Puccinia graminis f. sp. tritici]|uniref:Uncharacterized protein n=1 Tax=Puccinia graminis f. sp. tritici TaxID=56615 RepID=A0A5B0MIE7_PUCGR|nr:hypothetical protein PGT21_024898 [Puccinia graminis f. sp. tritici]KAA1118537.1 hypothetical protein PGTUg99_001242 [Puccinia graminis f. sp. tritici]